MKSNFTPQYCRTKSPPSFSSTATRAAYSLRICVPMTARMAMGSSPMAMRSASVRQAPS